MTDGAVGLWSTGRKRRERGRDRIFIVLTANMAILFGVAGYRASDYMFKFNLARSFDLLMSERAAKIKADMGEEPEPGREAPQPETNIYEQIGIAEAIPYVWRYIMYAAAVILEIIALAGAAMGAVRRPHIAAGIVILLTTVLTLVGMYLLGHQSFGGLDPLPFKTYLLVAFVQGFYGVVLLAALPVGHHKRRDYVQL